ncbi:MAG: hydantoinase B/oxoprolinase family protein [Thalassobaculum sp.]
MNHGNAPISTATIPPLEILEAAYPVRVHAMGAARGLRRCRPDTGAGSARSTRSSCWRTRRRRSCSANAGDTRRPAWSAARRRPSTASPIPPALTAARRTRRWPRKWSGIKLIQGQSVRLETPGGGGYGAADGARPGPRRPTTCASAMSAPRRPASATEWPSQTTEPSTQSRQPSSAARSRAA